MANQLIHLDDKHIFNVQLQMTYINNLSEGAPEVIHGHLRDVGFLIHGSYAWGAKLDPSFVSAWVERWRQETHALHLPCDGCTITLEDVNLQLNLPINGDVVTGLVISADWSATYEKLLGNVSNKFKGSHIKM
ncbi:hypothetical protein J1N35_041079 [Gossypium stocksii]|uniref:Aminotransferase-like plant mobile domain-containing protein n=1 Tax=Gossypium stocksii TaxID=47602 RepID=A0A9D3UET1_9ROSI|nr:hypothetical protein J1N35_041079 [Gossypium stocksii]